MSAGKPGIAPHRAANFRYFRVAASVPTAPIGSVRPPG